MAYSDFTLEGVIHQFGLTIDEGQRLFLESDEAEISQSLRDILQETAPLALAIHTEKARSEFIVAPILVELRKLANHKISLFSGVDFTIDKEKGLNGSCDFIVAQSQEQLFVKAPVLMIVEAKNNNIKGGLGQCIAAMIAAQLFNEQKGNEIAAVYGLVTTGSIWKFIKLEGQQLFIDQEEYYLKELTKIMGVLLHIAQKDENTEG